MAKGKVAVSENLGPRGVSNPNHVPNKGNWWNPETGYGGEAAPPAAPLAEQRFNERVGEWREENWDLAGNQDIENVLGQHVLNRVNEGLTLDAAIEDATATVRMVIPKPKVSREVWTAEQEVNRLAADRTRHGMQPGNLSANRIANRGGR